MLRDALARTPGRRYVRTSRVCIRVAGLKIRSSSLGCYYNDAADHWALLVHIDRSHTLLRHCRLPRVGAAIIALGVVHSSVLGVRVVACHAWSWDLVLLPDSDDFAWIR